ncbi:MAG: TlyA family RNA methyltransferase [Magnetococcales bacterium]|nr:TlyA family RNA methyltransferase [Magnetococcales bacterium]
MVRERLDKLLLARGLASSRERAQALILAGEVVAGERLADKPGTLFPIDIPLRLKNEEMPWVSRGALKLLHALDLWAIDATGRVCLDAGASTGGFTDVLLSRGALRVYAVDVGHGQLAWKLTQDPRVISREGVNVRYLTPEQLPEAVELLTMDVSFISQALTLPPAAALLKPGGTGVTLIKPQFEVGREKVGKGGVVREESFHQEAVERVRGVAAQLGLRELGWAPSPILGPKGNKEFLFAFRKPVED